MKNQYYALWLSLVCIIVFAMQFALPGFSSTFLLDQKYPNEVWRFITSIFLHGSLGHLLANLFALAIFGTILENYIGSKKFFLLFFASGIIANLVAIWFYPTSLGASGAIYGILGALAVMRPGMVVWVYGIPMPMIIAGVVWIAGGVLGLFYPSDVGHIAHLSGIGVGLIFGLIFKDWEAEKMRKFGGQIKFDESSIRKWEDNYIRNN